MRPNIRPPYPDEEFSMISLPLRLAAGAALLLFGLPPLGATAALAQNQPSTTQPTASQPAATGAKADPVVAIVNGQTLRKSDVVASAQSLPAQYRNQIDQIFPALINRLIDITLMVSEGKRQHLQDDSEVKKIVAQYEDQAIREVLVRRFLADKLTDAALKKRYDEMVKGMAATVELRASHVLLANEADAKAVIKQLDGGGDFAKLAKEKSKDPTSGANGGDLGYFSNGEMVPEFWEAASKLKPGEYTETPVKSQFGWHVIKLVDRRTKPAPKFDDIKDQVRDDLTQALVTAWLADLHKGAKIQRFKPDGTPAADQPQ
jgi:peptidyl-prolyl cis-trans isomerase C